MNVCIYCGGICGTVCARTVFSQNTTYSPAPGSHTDRLLEERNHFRDKYFELQAEARKLQAKVDEQEALLWPQARPDHERVVMLAARIFEEIGYVCEMPPEYEFTFDLEKTLREAFGEIRRDEAAQHKSDAAGNASREGDK